jgi:hypothetical protein
MHSQNKGPRTRLITKFAGPFCWECTPPPSPSSPSRDVFLPIVKHVWIMRCKRGRLLFFTLTHQKWEKSYISTIKYVFYTLNDFTRFWVNSLVDWTETEIIEIISELHPHFVIVYDYLFLKKGEKDFTLKNEWEGSICKCKIFFPLLRSRPTW